MFVEVIRCYIETLPLEIARMAVRLARSACRQGAAAHSCAPRRGVDPGPVGARSRPLAHRLRRAFLRLCRRLPLHYLTGWRLQLARRLLEQTGFGVARAAAEVGYESEAAFNRAFKKFVGVPPGAWRKGRLLSTESKPSDPI